MLIVKDAMTFRQSITSLAISSLDVPVLRARVSMRMLQDTTLPAYKGGLLRGGFGYAFQQTSCPTACWNNADSCTSSQPCAYQHVFSPRHPANVTALHDLRDIPRPFVIEPPADQKRDYRAGDLLEFGLVIIGSGARYLPYFLASFRRLGELGLGRDHAPARLERVELLACWEPTGTVIYQDGRVLDVQRGGTYQYTGPIVAERALHLPDTLHISLPTPLRIKARGTYLDTLDVPALVQSLCWRLHALSVFYGSAWQHTYRPLVEQARSVVVEDARVEWIDWERTSTRGPTPRHMTLGGIVGTATLRNVPPDIRALLLMGTLVHAGKSCVFGHGKLEMQGSGVREEGSGRPGVRRPDR